MATNKLKIAVISDLHCHPNRTKTDGINESYLLTDKLRSPSNDHPVENLINLIKKEKLKVDLTLCPGDFTDKASVQGFISGWDFSLELHNELKSKEIIATLGNHDVDAYNVISNYSLKTAKGIKKGFPVQKSNECDTFWSKGCVFIERKSFRVLVINSSHFHHNRASSHSGKVDDDMLEYVGSYLEDRSDNKIQIALSHHHPIDHSALKLGEEDKIVNSDELLNILGKYKFDLFIHGHKHHPLLRYHQISNHNYKLPILSSGSFSSHSNLMFTSVRNSFHTIEITKDSKTSGNVTTYTYFPNSGWTINFDEKGFAPYSGFGNDKTVEELYNLITALINNKTNIPWVNVIQSIPQLKSLIPTESQALYDLLKKNNYLLDEHLWSRPTQLYNQNSLNP